MKTLKLGVKHNDVIYLHVKLKNLGYQVDIYSDLFTEITNSAVKKFQSIRGLSVDGIVGNKTWEELENLNKLTESDFIRCASSLGVDVATVKAVCEVESGCSGFIGLNKPTILFEGHIFWRELRDAGYKPENYTTGNEDILYKSWNKEHYLGGLKEYDRLEKAIRIDRSCALKSASWGLFQIMGFNYFACGCDNVEEFVSEMKKSEGSQLDLFIEFIRRQGWGRYLRDLDWAGFASKYNGPGYKENKYDEKLERAYKKFKKERD